MIRKILIVALGLLFVPDFCPQVFATVPLETETAHTQPRGAFEADAAFEYQLSSEGKEIAVPLAFEYGILENLEILIEPVLYTSILPDTGKRAMGLGDLEVTLNYRFLSEQDSRPAFGVAAELKLPTARDSLIGTGQTDFTCYFIASKTLGIVTLHGNLGYTWVGEPKGVHLNNLYSYAFAVEQNLSGHWQFLAEVLGNSTLFAETQDGGPENPITPEAAGGVFEGTLGIRYFFNHKTAFALGLTYDNSNAVQIAPSLILAL